MKYIGYWCREMSEIPFYVAFDIRYNKLEPPGYTPCTQYQRTLWKHAPGDDIVLTSALIISGWLIRKAIHFHGFHRLVSHLKRRGAASRTSYQIRKLLYDARWTTKPTTYCYMELHIDRTERSAVTWNSIIEFWIGTRSTPWVLSIYPGTASFMVFHYFLVVPGLILWPLSKLSMRFEFIQNRLMSDSNTSGSTNQ